MGELAALLLDDDLLGAVPAAAVAPVVTAEIGAAVAHADGTSAGLLILLVRLSLRYESLVGRGRQLVHGIGGSLGDIRVARNGGHSGGGYLGKSEEDRQDGRRGLHET
ncbi:hypothetical protein BN1723_003641 [Verticillium longisporum]|uniref:Uncharacterized protein n=1 Tax=Verticillium longisporum TaxID=100787 RepID=A0A0G4M6A0_VERLO|nr:hypothetical protein BN1723_003641 [Verticillium longisporum]